MELIGKMSSTAEQLINAVGKCGEHVGLDHDECLTLSCNEISVTEVEQSTCQKSDIVDLHQHLAKADEFASENDDHSEDFAMNLFDYKVIELEGMSKHEQCSSQFAIKTVPTDDENCDSLATGDSNMNSPPCIDVPVLNPVRAFQY